MTITEAVQDIASSLRDISDAPELDAQRMILEILSQRDASFLLAHGDEMLSNSQIAALNEMKNKRMQGMPLAYILGTAEFYGRIFKVTPDVLVPRPETEGLIEKALEVIPMLEKKLGHPPAIADIGTGSGCIAITLALELPHYRFIATDISPAALAVAKENATRHGVVDRIEFFEGDMLTPLTGISVDLIVSNPPYVPTSELFHTEDTIETRGLAFEPRIALDGGVDGTQVVNQLEQSGIPALIETVGGEILKVNI